MDREKVARELVLVARDLVAESSKYSAKVSGRDIIFIGTMKFNGYSPKDILHILDDFEDDMYDRAEDIQSDYGVAEINWGDGWYTTKNGLEKKYVIKMVGEGRKGNPWTDPSLLKDIAKELSR